MDAEGIGKIAIHNPVGRAMFVKEGEEWCGGICPVLVAKVQAASGCGKDWAMLVIA